jgi:hypothetical protein
MKRIAIVLFEVKNNLGGILPFVRELYAGLSLIGVKPRIFHLEWKESLSSTVLEKRTASATDLGHGLLYRHQGNQIQLTSDEAHSFPYKGKAAYPIQEMLAQYDGVILASSVPSYGAKTSSGDHDWKIVLEHGKPMVGVVHDCHWLRLHPNLMQVRNLFTCLVGVHPAAYNSLKNFPGRISCQVNPFDISLAEKEHEKDWDRVCVTSWAKAWKHVDDAIRMAPYLNRAKLELASGGIEIYYMQATLKSKEEYQGKYYGTYSKKVSEHLWHRGDRSVKSDWIGKRIWDTALESKKMTFHGFLMGKKLEKLQSECGGLADFSYNYQWGEHFNRVVVEAMIHHSIPFARPFGISDNSAGKGIVFSDRNVVLIPEIASPRRTAEIIESSLKDHALRKALVSRNLAKLGTFDRRVVARHYLRLLNGDFDVMPEITQGETKGKLDSVSRKVWEKVPIRSPRIVRRFPR